MATIFTGWRGLAVLGAAQTALRFTSESVNIPLEINVSEDTHAGMRTDSVYSYGLVKPNGSISFPLTSDNYQGFTTTVSPTIKTILQNALLSPPTLWGAGEDLYLYRGDVAKYLQSPWIEKITISGDAGNAVTVELGIRAIYGEYREAYAANNSTLTKARALMFNELDWAETVSGLKLATANNDVITPRSFSITIETGIVDDDSYNNTNPRALRGFATGKLKVYGSLSFVGAAVNYSNVTPPRGAASGEGNFIPWSNSVNMGDLFTVLGGIWDSRTMNIPGMNEIAKTDITFKALFSLADAGGDITALPIALGSLLT